MKSLIILLTYAMMGGSTACANLTEEQRYERENRLILAREEFAVRSKSCRESGGAMQIERHGTRREFDYFEYKNARCVRY